MPAAEKVFGLLELMEDILLYLDYKQLFAIERFATTSKMRAGRRRSFVARCFSSQVLLIRLE
ncbi:hypothetical protein LTR08_001405 [Meristemomyces frigidus]|nr:hypothetical protein LTR08_001405 [Meristemomyces frigidus]